MPLFKIKKEVDTKYTAKVLPPQYLPSAIAPKMHELCDLAQYKKLMQNINKSDIPDEIKDFLKLGATRHIVFNYAKIADFYAHAEPEVQRLMEESALVIIDIDDAIVNGYVKLSKNIKQIMDQTGRRTKDES